MRKITKGAPPVSFDAWVRKKPKNKDENQWFQELYEQKRWDIVSDLSHHNAKEQYLICAYCCDEITGSHHDTVNEHVEARALASHRSLDPDNIVASCKTKGQCDSSHKSQSFALTPLMDECETELQFKISGRVEGASDRAVETIRVLNLGDNERNNKSLIEKRKQLVENLMWVKGVDPNEGLEDDELLEMLIDELLVPEKGKMLAFAPVVVNILRSWVAS